MLNLTEAETAWLAGLFEGEGNVGIASNGGTRITIRMTDRDIIERLHRMIPTVPMQTVKSNRANWSDQYAWRVSKPEQVREILTAILPWLGERRSAKAQEVIVHLDTRPGTGGFHRQKTHCAKGHPFSPQNTYVPPGRNERHCRACAAEWARKSRAKLHAQNTNPNALQLPFT